MTLRRSTRVQNKSALSAPPQSPASTIPEKLVSQKRKESKTSEHPSKRSKPAQSDQSPFKKPIAPETPAKSTPKRSQRVKVPPLTPTPSLVNTFRAAPIDDPTIPPPSLSRPTDPHITNATLVTPGGTQATAFPVSQSSSQLPDISPSKVALPANGTTTGTLLEKACAHLVSVDPKMAKLIARHHCAIFSPAGLAEKVDPFRSLTSGICGQQVSGAAAKAIKNKFVALYNEDTKGEHVWPTPKEVAETSIEKLRTAGLSQRKAEYIQGLAEKFVSGELSTRMLLNASDEEVMEKLIAVRGLGKWSVEMFMCFGLKRMDILSTGDLGVQRGMAAHFGRDVSKLKAKGGGKWKYMSEQDMLAKSEVYAPYRSLFMWYMWRVEDVDITFVES
ncbi:3-methyladenine DNA glycosylase [Neophaeococcomyces mojaviensis]|uniref:3-methyladenine DNA glycosylase n=1 Tax=Neophaeococcomyces mojaviensis TaxID=3383035 RepID=A0ACC3ADX3_9EURO|nr:3-methyladenine DNA glycosylase [Knufia sp. JES_112]